LKKNNHQVDSADVFNVRKKEITRVIAEFNAGLNAADVAEQREFDALVQAYAAGQCRWINSMVLGIQTRQAGL